MQQLDAITLKALAKEFSLLLDGAKVSKVQHASAHEFLITFWGGPDRRDESGDAKNLFYIQLNPEAPFCALIDNQQRQETVLHTFEKPTAICMLLRKHLNGANVIAVRTLPGERVLELVFENFNELGNRVRLVLSLELMGKHSNMIFYDDVQENILAVAHGVSERMSSVRELAAGLPYAPPPRPVGKHLLSEMTTDDFVKLWQAKPKELEPAAYLNQQVAGLGLRVVQDILEQAPDDPKRIYQMLSALNAGRALAPSISADEEAFTLISKSTQPNQTQWNPLKNVNDLMQAYFIKHLQTTRLLRRRQQLLLLLGQQLKKWQRREKELVPIADEEITQWQATGDRLLAARSAREVAGENPTKGVVTLTHYESGVPWNIEVDPSGSWVDNAQLYYRRAQKAKARKANYEQMAEQLTNEREYLETLTQLTNQAETLAELDAIDADLKAAFGNKKPVPEKQTKKKPPIQKAQNGIMTLCSSDGAEIWVGKSGQGNEAIVGKLSRSDDTWLHVHQMPGSHVLVRGGPDELSKQTLLEAATLAVWYSSARDSLNVPVIYTRCKYVRKIPHSYPGHVNYREEQTVFITPDPALVEQLTQAKVSV